MLPLVVRRILLLAPVLLVVVLVTFFASRLVPADPASLLIGEGASSSEYQRIRTELGLDKPLATQAIRFVTDVVRGDLGTSIKLRRPVTQDLWRFYSASVELGLAAFVLALLTAVPLGVLAAVKYRTWVDQVIRVVSLGGIAIPIFWFALVAQLVLYGQLDLVPGGGRYDENLFRSADFRPMTGFLLLDTAASGQFRLLVDVLRHILLPAAVLAYPTLAIISRMTRSAMLDVLVQDFVRTARAVGVPERRIVVKHAFRNAVPTVLTILGLALGNLLQGSILVETVFNWPGVGLYLYGGVISLDYPVVIGVTLVLSVNYVLMNLLVDISYGLADPRIRYA